MGEQRFSGTVAVVTGAAKGFGEAISRRFVAEGASVVLGDFDTAGEAVAADLGERAAFRAVDVTRSEDVAALVSLATERFGRLDVLCNNAGYSHLAMPMHELPEEDFDRQFAVNVKGVYLGCKHAVPVMIAQGGGVIVNTASIGAKRPRSGVTAYNASKGAVVTLTRGLAHELGRHKIRVNAVCPVASNTAFMEGVRGGERLDERARGALVRGIPLGRLCEPADVAASVTFLASEDAAFLTGVCLDVDGGRSIE
ncbi:MAG: glucose 1-dehydrogenase [Acidimicrobiia bacterium]|nr:glucose 1-dehydrogenase [Acidimicrobiia bacterium]